MLFTRLAACVWFACFASLSLAASSVVEITYDAAGNLKTISREQTSTFGITSFAPTSGAVAATVTVYGTGFSATPANNVVKFNGTAATVTASEGGSISTSVPSGATTGRITVTVGASTATSATDFVVTVAGAPTITSFSPSSGATATSVAVAGTDFNTAAGATSVTLNGVAATSSVASSTSLSFAVPAAAASGRIVATTATGAGVSAQDFIVPPPGTTASEIVAAVRVVPNGAAATLAVGTANTRGLILFDGDAEGYYTVQFGQLAVTPSSSAIAYSIVKPDNTILATGTFGIGARRPTIHVPKLPVSGTYSVLVSPGLATFNSNVTVVADPPVTIDGSAVVIALDTIGQSTRLAFTATAGQRIGFGIAGLTLAPSNTTGTGLGLYKPDGSLESGLGTCYATGTSNNPQGNCDAEIATLSTGVYTIIVEPPIATSATFNTQLTSEVTGTLVADTGLDVTLGRVGQDARLTFTANAGDSLGLALSGITASDPQTFSARVYKPDGSLFVQTSAMPPYGGHAEMGTFAVGGTYSVVLDPDRGAFGTARLTLKTGPTLLPTDPSTTFAPVTIAEAARFRFSGAAGQNLVVAISNLAYVGSSGSSSTLSIHRPDGTQVGQSVACFAGTPGRCKATLTNLPATGVYSAVLVPAAGVKITGNVSVSEDITGTLVAGTPMAVNAARDGQNARLTFAGTAGESTSLKLYGVSTTPAGQSVYAYIYKPDGSVWTSTYATAATSLILDLGPLPATGNYQVLAYSFQGHPWQGTFALDPGAMIVIDGAVTSVASLTGEPLRYRFSGVAGQLLELGLTGLAYTPSGTALSTLTLYRPGTSSVYINCSTTGAGACETTQAILPTTGVYSITLVPPGANAITGGSLAVSTPLAGTFVVGDPAQTVAIQRPGQTARYTFSGTSGQLRRLNWTGASVSGGASVQATVVKPDGSTLSSSSFTNGASGGFDIASLPVTGTYTVVLNPASAATASASLALVTR